MLGDGVVLLVGGRWGILGKGAAVLVVVGLMRVCRERWVMGMIRCYGMIGGLVRFLSVCVFGGCLT